MNRYAYSFTNHFDQSNLKNRIRMMSPFSENWNWWRYGLLGLLMLGVVGACQSWDAEERQTVSSRWLASGGIPTELPVTNPSRAVYNEQMKDPDWQLQVCLLKTDSGYATRFNDYRTMVAIRENRLALNPFRETDTVRTRLLVNGKPTPLTQLSQIEPSAVAELMVLIRYNDQTPDSPDQTILVQTGPVDDIPSKHDRKADLFQFLKAVGLSADPMGNSYSFDMNGLLEATFFERKEPMVRRTKDQHLHLYEEYRKNITLFIDGREVSVERFEKLHVREIDKLYAHERPYREWMNAVGPLQQGRKVIHKIPPRRLTRYVVYVETAPNRRQRDSSYYVFSPFYSGDF